MLMHNFKPKGYSLLKKRLKESPRWAGLCVCDKLALKKNLILVLCLYLGDPNLHKHNTHIAMHFNVVVACGRDISIYIIYIVLFNLPYELIMETYYH